jgi:hypothetical protein
MFAKSLVAVVTLACSALIGAAASSSPMVADSRTFVVPLSGHAHPPSRRLSGLAGDSDGSGLVKIQVDLHQKQICYDFSLSGVATPLMAHIHKAPALQDGPTVVTLFTGPGGELRDCLLWTDKWLAQIVTNPSDFYVNLYTTEYPDGAVRGQLADG